MASTASADSSLEESMKQSIWRDSNKPVHHRQQHQQQQQLPMEPSIHSTGSTTIVTHTRSTGSLPLTQHTSGMEFYDDGYTEEEADAAEPPVKLNLEACFCRTKELQLLQDCRRRILACDDSTLPGVLVSGIGGTGKLKLVQQFLDQVQTEEESTSYILHGQHDGSGTAVVGNVRTGSGVAGGAAVRSNRKSDALANRNNSSDPFMAIVQAFTEFATQLQNGPAEELERIRSNVHRALGSRTGRVRGSNSTSASQQSKRDSSLASNKQQRDPLDARSASTSSERNATINNDNISNTNTNTNINTNSDLQHHYEIDQDMISALTAIIPQLSITLSPKHAADETLAASSFNSSSAGNITSHLSTITATSAQRPLSVPTSTAANSWNRLQYVFLQFVKAVATKERPLYLFLDNLQSASSLSLELVAKLISDPELKYFMFLGTIQKEDDNHDTGLSMASSFSSLPVPNLSNHFRGISRKPGPDGAADPTLTSNIDDDNVPDNPPIQKFLDQLDETGKPLEQITLTDLSLPETGQLVADILQRTVKDCEPLTVQIHAKTRGNILFTVQALEELERNQILIYSRICFQWEWNLPTATPRRISRASFISRPGHSLAELPISNTVLQSIASKLKQMDAPLQITLAIAAYIRPSFDVRILQEILHNEARHPNGLISDDSPLNALRTDSTKPSPLMDWLEKAVLEGLVINPLGGTKYGFAHDKIHQAAAGLVDFGEKKDTLRARIGKRLFELWKNPVDESPSTQTNDHANNAARGNISDEERFLLKNLIEQEGLLFVAADHLNSTPTKDHFFSMALNLDIGEKAIEMAALAPAATYLQRASMALQKLRSPWENHYEHCLRLYHARCAVELSLGHSELGQEFGEEVFKRARVLEDKLESYLSLAQSLGRQDHHMESRSLCRSVAKMMKIFPKRKVSYVFHVAKDLRIIKTFLRQHTNEQIHELLPLTTDKRAIIGRKVLAELQTRAFMTKGILEWTVTFCKSLRSTIKLGISQESGMAWACLGLFLLFSGDLEMGIRCADLAHGVLERIGGAASTGWVCFLTANYIYAFSHPDSEIMSYFQQGYAASMEAGDFEVGFTNCHVCNITAFSAGYPLGPLIKALESTKRQSALYRVESMSSVSVGYLFLTRTLAGELPLDWDDMATIAARDTSPEHFDPSETYSLASLCATRIVLAILFFKYEWAEAICEKIWFLTSHEKSHSAITQRSMMTGLMAAGRYRQTGRRRYLKQMRKMIVNLGGLKKMKGAKDTHHCRVLEAEELSLRHMRQVGKDVKPIQKAYDEAIQEAAANGYIQDAAMVAELAGEFFLRSEKHTYVQDYFVKALQLYEEWGAHAKVNDLKERRALYIDQSRSQWLNSTRPSRLSQTVQDMDLPRRTSHDLISVYTPAMSMIGSSISGRNSRSRQADQQDDDIDDNMSVLTDGSG